MIMYNAQYSLQVLHIHDQLKHDIIRVGSKGHDSNLPAIVTIKAGSKGHDLNLPTIVTISTGSRDMIDTACREERSGWKGTEENVIKPTPQVVDSLLFCYFDIIYICIYQCCMGQ